MTKKMSILGLGLLSLISCSDNPQSAGGWTGTENGIKASVVDTLGQTIRNGLVISARVDQWVDATAKQVPVPYDTAVFQNGSVEKVWNDSIPRIVRVVSGDLEIVLMTDNQTAKLQQIELNPKITVAGYVNAGFDAVHVLGTEQKDGVDGDNFYVISDVPTGLQVFLLRQGNRMVFGGRINVFNVGVSKIYDLFACPDNPSFDGKTDYRGWYFAQFHPIDTLAAVNKSVGFNPGMDTLGYTLNGGNKGVIPANQEFNLGLEMGKNTLRLNSASNQPACLELWVK